MIKKVLINDVDYDVQDGLVYKDTATEELDSGVFQILNSPEINLEPMQKVVIEFANGTKKYMLINTWVEENATFDTNLKNYIINYISETKKLERVQMPNTAITQPLGYNDENKRKYDLYIQRCVDNYIKKIYPEVEVSTALKNAMSNVIAVEEQFTTPNTKEYLNNILAKLSYLIKLENNWLTYVDLSAKNNPIDENKLFLKTSNQTIEDYYSSIYTDVQNAQSEVTITEVVSPRAINSSILTTDNLVVELSHNINTIKRVYVYGQEQFEDSYGNKINYGVEIYGEPKYSGDLYWKRVVEKSQYDCLKFSEFGALTIENGANYKMGNLYFTRGGNTIEGLNFKEANFVSSAFGEKTAIEFIIEEISKAEATIPPTFTGDIRLLAFRVEYTTLDDVSVELEKHKNTKSVVRDNQTDSIVDLDKFVKVQQEKINRLGNEAITIAGRYDSLDDVPQLLDYIDDYVLAEREMVIYSDFVEFKGMLYKNYVKKNVFYGVNAKLRNTQLLMPNEAVVRKELTKETFTFGFEDKTTDKEFTSYLLSGIAGLSSAKKDEYTNYIPFLVTKFTSEFEYGNTKEFRIEPNIYVGNTSIFLNYKFTDNINAGAKIGRFGTGGYEQKYIPYTDSLGKFNSLKIQLYRKLTGTQTKTDIFWAKEFPDIPNGYIDETKEIYNKTLVYNKDNREIINHTIQLDFKTEPDIYINQRLMDIIPLIGVPTNEAGNKNNYYLWISTEEKYNESNKDKVVASAVMQDRFYEENVADVDIQDLKNYGNNNIYFNRILLYNINTDNVVSWAIATAKGEVALAVNKRDSDTQIATTIYLNKEE